MFTGFTRETLDFFMGIRFDNSASYYEANRDVYKNVVQKEFRDFCEAIAPAVTDADPLVDARPQRCVSRLRRDTRYTKDKTPYRDHLWICFRRPGEEISGSFTYFFEMSPDAYQYGCGMYGPDKPRMDAFRRHVLAAPEEFLSIVEEPRFRETFLVYGEGYKRPVVQTDDVLMPWCNRKYIGLQHRSVTGPEVFSADFARKVARDLETAAPFYRFMRES